MVKTEKSRAETVLSIDILLVAKCDGIVFILVSRMKRFIQGSKRFVHFPTKLKLLGEVEE